MNLVDKIAIFVVVVLLSILGLVCLVESDYPKVTIQDLYHTTWDKSSSEIVGKYNGSIIRRNQFEVWTLDYDKDKEIEWCDYYGETVTLINKFQNWKITVENNKCYDLSQASGMLKILDENNNALVFLR